jgi:thiol-disulfide isomerase/thioredoxin
MFHRRTRPQTDILVLLVLLVACQSNDQDPAGDSVHQAEAAAVARLLPGPDFELLGLDGRPHRLSGYRGKVVLVNFWATWCMPCREEIPHLNTLYTELQPAGVEILGIATDVEGEEKVRPFAEELAILYPVLLDPEEVSAAIFGGIPGYPSTFILDTEGLLYSSYLGAQPPEILREDLTYLLHAAASLSAPLPPSQ